MERPADLRIEDLARPHLSPAAREMMEGVVAASPPVEFTADALLSAACAETGLDDFGDDTFRAPLDVLLHSLEHEANLSPFGRFSYFQMLLGLARNRLRIEDLIRQNPAILDVEIRRPIVIAGLQRTGTTHLHNLLSADPEIRFLPYWESLEPVPASLALPDGEPDPRRTTTEMALGFQDAVMPHFKRMHEMTVDHAHEEIQLLAIDFSTMFFESVVALPSYRDWYVSHRQTPHYRYLERCLKVLTWLRGGKRWVLKSPQHIEQVEAVTDVFPDATVVFTHRDPVSVLASTTTMLAYSARMHQSEIDTGALGTYWTDRTEQMLRACVRDRDRVPASASLDVLFHEYMRDDMAVVESIYEVADQPLTDVSRAAMDAYMREHPRGRFGRIAYKLADFGLDAGEIRRRFSFYVDRFHIQEEKTAL